MPVPQIDPTQSDYRKLLKLFYSILDRVPKRDRPHVNTDAMLLEKNLSRGYRGFMILLRIHGYISNLPVIPAEVQRFKQAIEELFAP